MGEVSPDSSVRVVDGTSPSSASTSDCAGEYHAEGEKGPPAPSPRSPHGLGEVSSDEQEAEGEDGEGGACAMIQQMQKVGILRCSKDIPARSGQVAVHRSRVIIVNLLCVYPGFSCACRLPRAALRDLFRT